jgi:hypothetical protein
MTNEKQLSHAEINEAYVRIIGVLTEYDATISEAMQILLGTVLGMLEGEGVPFKAVSDLLDSLKKDYKKVIDEKGKKNVN